MVKDCTDTHIYVYYQACKNIYDHNILYSVVVLMDILEKAKGFLSEPSNAFESSKYDRIEDALKYYVIVSAIFSALLALMIALISYVARPALSAYLNIPGTGLADILSNFILFLIMMFVTLFIWSGVLHIFIYIMGEKKELKATIKAVMYASTPLALLGWLPLIGVIGWIWSCVLQIVGIKQYHDITTGKAIATLVIPIIISFLIAIVLIAGIVSFVVSLVQSPG